MCPPPSLHKENFKNFVTVKLAHTIDRRAYGDSPCKIKYSFFVLFFFLFQPSFLVYFPIIEAKFTYSFCLFSCAIARVTHQVRCRIRPENANSLQISQTRKTASGSAFPTFPPHSTRGSVFPGFAFRPRFEFKWGRWKARKSGRAGKAWKARKARGERRKNKEIETLLR